MPANESRFGVIRMRGGRYDEPGLPLVGASELRRYEQLVMKVARSLYMRSHPRRKRAPRGFTKAITLRLTDLEAGSVIPVLERSDYLRDDSLVGAADYYEEARLLINDALKEFAGPNGHLDRRFPPDCLPEFAAFGRSLQVGESIEFSNDGSKPAILDLAIRRRIQEISHLDLLEVELVVHGQITGLRSTPQQFDFVVGGTDRKLVGAYADSTMWNELKDFQGYADRAPMVALSVVAEQSQSGEIHEITDVLNVEAALPAEWAKRIEELSQLRSGWLTPDSPAPSADALDAAEQLLLACVDEAIVRPGIYPTPDGGVQLEWAMERAEVEIEFVPMAPARALWVSRVSEDEREASIEAEDVDALLTFIHGGIDD